jgi:hypothetical protein
VVNVPARVAVSPGVAVADVYDAVRKMFIQGLPVKSGAALVPATGRPSATAAAAASAPTATSRFLILSLLTS